MAGPREAGIAAVLRALSEPALVVEPDGRIILSNPAAAAHLGAGAAPGGLLTALCPNEDPETGARLRTYLDRCAGSRAALPGVVALRGADGATVRFRCSGALLEPAAPDGSRRARLLLRLLPGQQDRRFSLLARRLRELNAEIGERRRIQAELEEALREREVLVRELHHRVKNSLHMLVGMLGAARRDAASADAKAVLAEVERRLSAVGRVHQMLYGEGSLVGVRGDELVKALCPAVLRALGADPRRLSVEAAPIKVPNDVAVPLALILNELLTNALKHGRGPGGPPGGVRVRLAVLDDGAGFELVVEDDGPGFDPAIAVGRRASGLGLVRGLVRQLGGSFLVERGRAGEGDATDASEEGGAGARCIVRFGGRR
jgi:two-component sensor histidine kinase